MLAARIEGCAFVSEEAAGLLRDLQGRRRGASEPRRGHEFRQGIEVSAGQAEPRAHRNHLVGAYKKTYIQGLHACVCVRISSRLIDSTAILNAQLRIILLVS